MGLQYLMVSPKPENMFATFIETLLIGLPMCGRINVIPYLINERKAVFQR
jgi:hypothetical protein